MRLFETTSGHFSAYDDALRYVRDHGVVRQNRTDEPARSVFGVCITHDMSGGLFPAVTTKRLFWRGVAEELAWMLRGETNIRSLQDKGVRIWDEWADKHGELGPVYGAMWRAFPGPDGERVDQIEQLLDLLRRDPLSRRMLVSAWCPPLRSKQALPPCHYTWQVYVTDPHTDEARLHLHWTQRSADMFLGVPFNLASYALLTHLLAREVGMLPGSVTGTLMDAHIYENHIDVVDAQLSREVRPSPTLRIADSYPGLYAFGEEHVILSGYAPHGTLKGDVAV